jgi:hypothetical protein
MLQLINAFGCVFLALGQTVAVTIVGSLRVAWAWGGAIMAEAEDVASATVVLAAARLVKVGAVLAAVIVFLVELLKLGLVYLLIGLWIVVRDVGGELYEFAAAVLLPPVRLAAVCAKWLGKRK